MTRIPLAFRVVALLLVLVVATPWAAAAAPMDHGRFDIATPLVRLWSWLAHVWAKNGCAIDPGGRCLPGTSTALAPPAGPENGCGLDPSGRCQPTGSALSAADNGCAIDPWGRCGS